MFSNRGGSQPRPRPANTNPDTPGQDLANWQWAFRGLTLREGAQRDCQRRGEGSTPPGGGLWGGTYADRVVEPHEHTALLEKSG